MSYKGSFSGIHESDDDGEIEDLSSDLMVGEGGFEDTVGDKFCHRVGGASVLGEILKESG